MSLRKKRARDGGVEMSINLVINMFFLKHKFIVIYISNMSNTRAKQPNNKPPNLNDTNIARNAIQSSKKVPCFTMGRHIPNESIKEIPRNIPNNQCSSPNLKKLYHQQILGDGGISAGDDYYHDQFSTFQENIRRAGIIGGGIPSLYSSFPNFGGIFPDDNIVGLPGGPSASPSGPPPPASAGPTSTLNFGIYDTYLYFDSFFKDGTSNFVNGELRYSVVALNYNNPIDNIIQMEIGEFFIPDIVLPNNQPEFFFYKRVGLLINEMTTMSIFGNNNFRFHFEFNVQSAGISVKLTPINNIFSFSRPVRDFTEVTFKFTAPLKSVPFLQDTFNITSVGSTSNPGFNGTALQFITSDPHNLGSFDFIGPPAAGAITPVIGGAGILTGTYSWVTTFTTFSGETNVNFDTSPTSIALAADFASLSTIPTGPVGTTGRNIYRTQAGGSLYFFVGNIPDNTTTVFIDNNPDSSLGTALPISNTTSETATFAGFITVFNSNTSFDTIINSVNGHMFTIINATTIQMDPRSGITAGTIPVGSTGKIGIGLRRIAFTMRFRSLSEKITNRIVPI